MFKQQSKGTSQNTIMLNIPSRAFHGYSHKPLMAWVWAHQYAQLMPQQAAIAVSPSYKVTDTLEQNYGSKDRMHAVHTRTCHR
jgi:hypothetical protein